MRRRDFVCGAAAFALAAPLAVARTKPVFRIGLVTDVQFADKNDDPPHFYRAAPGRLGDAVAAFNRAGVDCAFNLGDVIQKDWSSFDTVLPVAAGLRAPWHYALGNHDFSVSDEFKARIPSRLGMAARHHGFEQSGWTFVVLDGTDLSTYGWPAGSAEEARGKAALARYPAGKPWNGAIGPQQLAWLDALLTTADARHRRVALLCHFPLLGSEDVVLWNAAEVLVLIEAHPCVRLWLNGHDHAGAYAQRAAIHHITFKGMLDTPQTAYAVLDFHPDRVDITGFGREQSRVLALGSG